MCWVGHLSFSLPIPAIPSPQPKPCVFFKFTEFLIKFKMSYSDPSALRIKSKFRANTQDSVPCKPSSTDLSQARLPAWSLAPLLQLALWRTQLGFSCFKTMCTSKHSTSGLRTAASRPQPYFKPFLWTQSCRECSSEFQHSFGVGPTGVCSLSSKPHALGCGSLCNAGRSRNPARVRLQKLSKWVCQKVIFFSQHICLRSPIS